MLHLNESGQPTSAYCLSRNLNQTAFELANSTYLDPCMAKKNYTDAWTCLNADGPHGAGHQGVGGVVSTPHTNPLTSSGMSFKIQDARHASLSTTNTDMNQMFQLTAAPGDPIFFLHHAYLDHVWWQWQQQDLPTRLYDMGGNVIPDNITLQAAGLGYPSASLVDYDGDSGNSTTLKHTLFMGNIVPNVTVGDVMDLGGEVICAEYILS